MCNIWPHNSHLSGLDKPAHFCTGLPSRKVNRRSTLWKVSYSTALYKEAGPKDEAPDYREIDAQPLNRLITQMFRSKMASHLNVDSPMQGYDAIIDLTRTLNTRYRTPKETQKATQKILRSLFPSWLLPMFRVMVSKPFPEASAKLNAWVTALTCQWLMGPCKVNDLELSDGTVVKNQGVLVERCRYLEQSSCASVCINSCKCPTQMFFEEDMGLSLTMTPDYDDFSCQFAFGQKPLSPEEDEAFRTPCFSQCPSKKPHRQNQCPDIIEH